MTVGLFDDGDLHHRPELGTQEARVAFARLHHVDG
jgi:hypothetical protein